MAASCARSVSSFLGKCGKCNSSLSTVVSQVGLQVNCFFDFLGDERREQVEIKNICLIGDADVLHGDAAVYELGYSVLKWNKTCWIWSDSCYSSLGFECHSPELGSVLGRCCSRFGSFPPGSPQAGVFELRRPQEERGRRGTREDQPGVHPEAGWGVWHWEATPGQHDERRSRELQSGGHRRKKAHLFLFLDYLQKGIWSRCVIAFNEKVHQFRQLHHVIITGFSNV